MPRMDGWRLTELIKATESGWYSAIAAKSKFGKMKTQSKCCVVAVTAYSSGIEERAKKCKIERVCQKPISRETIEDILLNYYWPAK